MIRKGTLRLMMAAVALLLAAGAAAAKAPKVGDQAPDWSGIIGIDDKEHGLADYKKAKVIVLVFTCNHCPVAVAYEDRIIALQKDYGAKGVQVIAVNVNNLPADRLDKMKQRAKDKKFNFPYIYDSSQKMGHDYGAKVTPHAFVLDADRKIAYIGAIDNSQRPDKATKHYVRDALDALLAGKTPTQTQTKAFGCTVKYEKKGRIHIPSATGGKNRRTSRPDSDRLGLLENLDRKEPTRCPTAILPWTSGMSSGECGFLARAKPRSPAVSDETAAPSAVNCGATPPSSADTSPPWPRPWPTAADGRTCGVRRPATGV